MLIEDAIKKKSHVKLKFKMYAAPVFNYFMALSMQSWS